MLKKARKYFVPVYILFLIVSFFWVRSVLNSRSLELAERDNSDEIPRVEMVGVTLTVEHNSESISYTEKMKNTDSLEDLFKRLRDREDFSYEKTGYIYGTEFEMVNGIELPEGYRWRVFKEGSEEELDKEEHKLENAAVYIIKPVAADAF
jgi:hypothetical protein